MCGNSFDSNRENLNLRENLANNNQFFENSQHTINQRSLLKKKDNSLEKFQETLNDFRSSKTSEMKYRVKLQEQENLILYLKNQAENLENKYMENLANMRKELLDSQEILAKQREEMKREFEEKYRQLEEKEKIVQREKDLEMGRCKALEEEIEKMREVYTVHIEIEKERQGMIDRIEI